MTVLAGTFNSSNGSLTVVINGQVYTVDKSHPNYDLLLESYKKSNSEDFLDLYTHKKSQEAVLVKEFVSGTGIVIESDRVLYNGRELHNSYARRILEAQRNGFPIGPMVKFFENLLQNPSSRSIDELPDFLMNRNLPLTEDGCFLAYKSVQSDWYSKARGDGSLVLISGKEADGRIYNAVGEVIECTRNQVDDDRDRQCSHGLHVGGLTYSGPGGFYNNPNDNIVIVKVNPKDVVAVPKDHNAQKVRVCKYEVIGVYERPLNDCCEGVEQQVPQTERLKFEDLNRLDEITFLYCGKNDDEYIRRFMIVEEVTNNYVFGILLPSDPSYEEGNESRKFMFDNMSDLSRYDENIDYETLDEDEDWDDEEDDENYSEWDSEEDNCY
jgi:hypothetical protein